MVEGVGGEDLGSVNRVSDFFEFCEIGELVLVARNFEEGDERSGLFELR